MPVYKLLICRYPYGGSEATECVDWLIKLACQIKQDKRFEVTVDKVNDTPITMTRNLSMAQAKADGFDFMLIVDSDMAPDCEGLADPTAKPFWGTSIDFMLKHAGPCLVAAPYCGPPPHENVYIFQWTTYEGQTPDPGGALVQYTREQAAVMGGIQEVAALPTGLMLIDLRALDVLPHPYTYYEYDGDGAPCEVCKQRQPGPQAKKASTEDVTFTRDLSLAGVPVYCNWDAWAGHIKRKVVRKPRPYRADAVAARMHKAILSRVEVRDQMVNVQADRRFQADVAKALAAVEGVNQFDPTLTHAHLAVTGCSSRAPAGSPEPVIPLTPSDLFPPFDPMNPRGVAHAELDPPGPDAGGGSGPAARAG